MDRWFVDRAGWGAGLVALLVGCAGVGPGAARAEVVAFEVTSQMPYGTFATGDYVQITGLVTGALDVAEPIPGLARADNDGDGRVSYTTDLTLIVPADPASGNASLLVDVENRGRPIAHWLYNSPVEAPLEPGSLDRGSGFLEDEGFLVAIPSWELGHGVELPTFTDESGARRHVEGAGFAVVRDVTAWLEGKDGGGTALPEPLRGAIARAYAVGYSQSARFLKSFLIHGFNALGGERVFEGMHLQAPHAGLLPLMQSGTGPESVANPFPTFNDPDLRGVHEAPFTYAEILEQAAGFDAPLPRLVVTNMANDYYSLRASLARTGPKGTDDVPLPNEARMYDVAGGAHAYLPGMPGCELPRGVVNWHPVMRAVLLRLDRWVQGQEPPPPSRLMPITSDARGLAVLGPPAHLPEATIQVPEIDADGNHVGGVRLPALEAPLGTHRGQNRPQSDVLCTLSGAFIPFAPSETAREGEDQRAPIAERYADQDTYVSQVGQAAERAVADGFMLPNDAAALVLAATQGAEPFR